MPISLNKKFILPVFAFFLLLSIWELTSRFYTDMAFVLPPPSIILKTVFLRYDRFLFHTRVTFKEMAGGFFIAFIVAFPLAWLMALCNSARLFFQPIFIVIQCIPMFTLAPIMVIWFNWSYTAIVIPTALMIFFPLTMNIYQGLRSTPKNLMDYFRINGATSWQTFWKLQLPWSMPHIFAGIRISAAIAGIGAIAGEWAGAQSGLGLLMLESRRGADLETTFGALFCLTLMSLALYVTTTQIERRISTRRSTKSPVIFLVFLSLFLWGCQSVNDKTRLVLDWLPNPNHVPIYVGIDKGFFKEQNIDLGVQKIHDPSDSLAYLISGQTDLAISYMPTIVPLLEKRDDIKPVAILIETPLRGLIFRSGEGIKTPQDLNGKILGYCIDGFHTSLLDTLMKNNQIKPKEKQNVSFDLASTLATKRVDVIYGGYWNIECEQIRSLGIDTDYIDILELGFPEYYELIILSKSDKDKDFIERFQIALQKSIDYCRKNPEIAFQIYLDANPDKGLKTAIWEERSWKKTIPTLAHKQEIDPEVWNHYKDWLSLHGLNRISHKISR